MPIATSKLSSLNKRKIAQATPLRLLPTPRLTTAQASPNVDVTDVPDRPAQSQSTTSTSPSEVTPQSADSLLPSPTENFMFDTTLWPLTPQNDLLLPASLYPPSPLLPSTQPYGFPTPPSQSHALPDTDWEWEKGYVRAPSFGDGLPVWPHGMYIRDMAKGFSLMAEKPVLREEKRSKQVKFTAIFGAPWTHSNYYNQWNFWKSLTVAEREDAKMLPRTPDGLWKPWMKMHQRLQSRSG
jgi:hypothetical protein